MKSKNGLILVIALIASTHIWQAYKKDLSKEIKTFANHTVQNSLKNISIITFK